MVTKLKDDDVKMEAAAQDVPETVPAVSKDDAAKPDPLPTNNQGKPKSPVAGVVK